MTMHDYVWLCMPMHDYVEHARPNMTMHDFLWLCKPMHDYVSLYMSLYKLYDDWVWLCIKVKTVDVIWNIEISEKLGKKGKQNTRGKQGIKKIWEN